MTAATVRDRLYPELRQFPAEARERVLEEARAAPFDFVEWIGLAGGLAAVTVITRSVIDGMPPNAGALRVLVNLVVALPLLVIFLGPCVVRSNRRALHRRLRDEAARSSADGS
jgi:hypothetical protein